MFCSSYGMPASDDTGEWFDLSSEGAESRRVVEFAG